MDIPGFPVVYFWLSIIISFGITLPSHADSPENHSFSGRNYIVITPRTLRPRTQFSLSVHVFDALKTMQRVDNRSFRCYVNIESGEDETITHEQILYWNQLQLIYLQTPSSLKPMQSHSLHVRALNDADEMVIFDERFRLSFDSRFVSVIFQTTRPIYKAGQIVRFRILVLDTNLHPFNDVLNVFILDPNGFIMKRWLSLYTNNGVVSLAFTLPKLAKNGTWKIRSRIDNQIDEKSIIVQTYYQPLFEVIVSSPPYVPTTASEIVASVSGKYTSQKQVRGNATIFWAARNFLEKSEFKQVIEDEIILKERPYDIALPMSILQSIFENLTGVEVKILAHVSEYTSMENVSGFSHTRIIDDKVVVKFLSEAPMIFTPGSFLHGRVVVSFEDGERLPQETLENSNFVVQMENDGNVISEVQITASSDDITDFYDKLIEDETKQRFLETSVLSFRFDVPLQVTRLKLKATFEYENTLVEEEMPLLKKYSSVSNEYLAIWTSSEDLEVEDYAIFHVSANFFVGILYVLILSKGIILRVAKYEMIGIPFTFSEPVSADMAPWFHLIVYCVTKNGEILGDTIMVPVEGFLRYNTELFVNTGKDFRAEQVELMFSGAEGAFIGIQAVRSVIFHLQGDHEVTKSRVVDSFLPFEKNMRALSRTSWTSRTGALSKETIYYPSHDYAYDAESVFVLNNLRVFSNMKLMVSFENRDCKTYPPTICETEECFAEIQRCKIYIDGSCTDGLMCVQVDERKEYFLTRINYHSFIFDAKEGDWAFRELKNNDHVGLEFENVTTPKTADDWYITAFNMDTEYGFSIVKAPVVFSTKRPLMAHVLGPTSCRRGEQLSLKLHVHNFDTNHMLVTVKLLASDDYRFVHVESEGTVTSYSARLSGGDHEIMIYMAAETENEIRFPVKPIVEQGIIEIRFHISSQAGRQLLAHSVHVLREGALINRHTSIILDLKNRGFVLQYLDIVVEESPIIPYEIMRRYIYGSPSANLIISNSIIGPAIGENLLSMSTILKRESKGAADALFELHTNIWSLHYLRNIDQIDWRKIKETLLECNTLYAEIMSYFNDEGWFNYWHKGTQETGSIWITSWALKIFKDACYPGWEFQFWIDPSVLGRIIRWLLKQQNGNGTFTELEPHLFDGRFPADVEKRSSTISLTANVLISLHSAEEIVDNEFKSDIEVACLKARIYLENIIATLDDPHLLSIVSYALTITNSPERNSAFQMLQKNMRTNNGLHYWSRNVIPENSVKVENQKPYLQPRTYNETDSGAVEATCWALLVHLIYDGVTPLVENIVEWLISMKMTDNGFVSLTDTAVAYQALTEFARRARILGITNIDVLIELVMVDAMKTSRNRIHVGNHSLVPASYLKIPQVWGHINLVGKGAGIAFVQMDVNYGIDHDDFKDVPRSATFDLTIFEFYSIYRNKSAITVQTCLRFIESFREVSGAAILEIQTPTGYTILESDALGIVQSKIHPTLGDARIVEGTSYWFFDYIEKDIRCFNHTVKRWFPVANMTLYRNALLYEVTAREKFVQTLINSTPLYTLSICEVCGSYQCPYCFYYNAADERSRIRSSSTYLIMLMIVAICINRQLRKL